MRSMFPRVKVYHPKGGPEITVQAEKEKTDINVIFKKYTQTGLAPINLRTGHFADVSNVQDFHSALTLVENVMDRFEALPAEVREYAMNDPAELLDIVQNPDRSEEFAELKQLDKDPANYYKGLEEESVSNETPEVTGEPSGESGEK